MRVTPKMVRTWASMVRPMPVEEDASGNPHAGPMKRSLLSSGVRRLKTASLYVLVCVVSFVAVVALFSFVESLWLGR